MEEQVKRCSSCHEICSIEEFTPTRPGRKSWNVCVTCRRKFNAERNRVYREKNAKAINARLKTKRLFKKFEKEEIKHETSD